MGVFRYFLPDTEPLAVTSDVICAKGLGDRLGDLFTPQGPAPRGVQCGKVYRGGPGGLCGTLIVPLPSDGGLVARADYHDDQTWIKSERGDYWIGSDPAEPPSPEGLLRTEVVNGYAHTLGDGREWLCPTIRRGVVFPAVPCGYSRMNGKLSRRPLSQYVPIFDRAMRWVAGYLGGDGLPPEDQWDAAVECLGINYRVGDEEASILELLNDNTLRLVVEAAIDLPWLTEAVSGADPTKAEAWRAISSALESTALGVTDASPDTSPQSPILCSADASRESISPDQPACT